MKIVIKLIKWIGILVFLLFALLILYVKYMEWSFDTETLPINHGKVNTELFLGSGEKQALIVGFGGSEGGNAWASDYWSKQRNSFIENGYAFLAVGYFGMEGTPEKLDRIALDAVHATVINTVKNNSQINSECIALIGGSKGAELALALSSYYSDYKAVVGIVPGHAIFASLTDAMITSSYSLNEEPLPFVPVPWKATPALLKADLRTAFEKMLEDKDAVENARIKVENIEGAILLMSAEKDEMWPSTEMSKAIMQTLSDNDFSYPYKHVAIDGGHSAPLDHFEEVENFLSQNFDCRI